MRPWLFAPLLFCACERDVLIVDPADAYGQTNPPMLETPSKTDRIIQNNPPKADILWVVDNSGSMSDNQNKLAREFESFAEFFEETGLRWHMGVITTDMDDPNYQGRLVEARRQKFLTPEVEDWQDIFRTMVRVGDSGSGSERGREAIDAALTDPLMSNFNKDFYREEASLHIILISDENDSSTSPSRPEFVNWLLNLKTDADMVTFNAIVMPLAFGYTQVVNEVGGLQESIFARTWTPMLEELGLQALTVKQEFFLSEVPVPGTIDLRVNKPDLTDVGIDLDRLRRNQTVQNQCEVARCFGFHYDDVRNSVVLDTYVPEVGSEIEITYDLYAQYQPPVDDQ